VKRAGWPNQVGPRIHGPRSNEPRLTTEANGENGEEKQLSVPSASLLLNPETMHPLFEPEVTFSWLSSKIGTEVSAFAGVDFNTENTEAHYTSGDVFHFDLTVAQHLPLFGGYLGVGANGYWIKQFTGDSGSGAVLGGFEMQELGVGPVVSYIPKMGKTTLAIDVKWVPQIDVQNTMNGDYAWVKVALVF
jgi:hypothetical protein